MDDRANLFKGPVERGVGVQVGRRLELVVEGTPVEVGDDHVVGSHLVIGNAARLDHHLAALSINAAGIAERCQHQPVADDGKVCVEDGLPEMCKRHVGELPDTV